MKCNNKTGVFHNFIALKFKGKCIDQYSNIIKRAEARKLLYIHSIPLEMHDNFLKEMVAFKLIKIKNKQNIELLRYKNGINETPLIKNDYFG